MKNGLKYLGAIIALFVLLFGIIHTIQNGRLGAVEKKCNAAEIYIAADGERAKRVEEMKGQVKALVESDKDKAVLLEGMKKDLEHILKELKEVNNRR